MPSEKLPGGKNRPYLRVVKQFYEHQKKNNRMIQVKNMSFRYPGGKQQVFSDFNLTLEGSHIYGLLGKNGTGKSTLLYLISGLLRSEKGSIVIDGVPMEKRRPEILSELFMVTEEFSLPDVKLSTYVDMNRCFYPRFSQEVLESCLRDFDLPVSLHLNRLSMGQKKKAYICFALATGTRYLLMDEPTNGLDIPSKAKFRQVVANNMSEGRTLIISTHQVHDIEMLLSHVVMMDNSRLLLNASLEEIGDKYRFEYRLPEEMDDSVLYAEPTLQGNAVMALRKGNAPRTSVNLELLFNALFSEKINL